MKKPNKKLKFVQIFDNWLTATFVAFHSFFSIHSLFLALHMQSAQYFPGKNVNKMNKKFITYLIILYILQLHTSYLQYRYKFGQTKCFSLKVFHKSNFLSFSTNYTISTTQKNVKMKPLFDFRLIKYKMMTIKIFEKIFKQLNVF